MQALIIPDLYEPISHWKPVQQQLEKVGIFTTVYEYRPPRNADVSEIVDDVRHHLVDETIVIGFGVGGRIAIQLAAQQPHQLAGLVLLSTPAMKAPSVRSYFFRVFMFLTTPLRILIPYALRKKAENLYKRLYPGDPKKMLYRSIVADEQDAFLNKISDPLFLLWGSKDRHVPPKVAAVMSETLDYADVPHDLQIVAGGDRMLHQSQPKLVANVVAGIAAR